MYFMKFGHEVSFFLLFLKEKDIIHKSISYVTKCYTAETLVPKTYDIKVTMISVSIISKENFTTQYYLHNKIIFFNDYTPIITLCNNNTYDILTIKKFQESKTANLRHYHQRSCFFPLPPLVFLLPSKPLSPSLPCLSPVFSSPGSF